jgi:hypothetical protein
MTHNARVVVFPEIRYFRDHDGRQPDTATPFLGLSVLPIPTNGYSG